MNTDLSWVQTLFSSVWGIALMILLLGGSIFVHELGHFLAARWRGLKVDRFSIGFGPRMFGWTGRDGVEYRVSWLPLGGYVALPQLADVRAIEGEPSTELHELPKISYLDKCIVVVAGVVFNLVFAFFIALVLWPLGVPMLATAKTQIVGYVAPVIDTQEGALTLRDLATRHAQQIPADHEVPGPAFQAGLRPGDRILAVDGEPIPNFRDFSMAIPLSTGHDAQDRRRVLITYERDGVTKTTEVFPVMVTSNLRSGDAFRQVGIGPAAKPLLDEVFKDSPAQRAGLQKGDIILTFNGEHVYSPEQFSDFIAENGDKPAVLAYQRDGKTIETTLQPVRIPVTTPLATVTVDNVPQNAGADVHPALLQALPIYSLKANSDRASPSANATGLAVWKVENWRGAFGDIHPGDLLEEVNGQPAHSIQQFVDLLNATPAGHPASLTYVTENQSITTSVGRPFSAAVTQPEQEMNVGVRFAYETINDHVTPWQQFSDAVKQTLATLGSLVNPHSDVGLKHLSGPVGIGRILYQLSVEDLREALWLTFIINVNLAIINLLPVPVLDGGHLLFFTIARLRRRELPVNFVAAAQGASLILLMGLIVYVFFNDSERWAGDRDREREAVRDDLYYLDRTQIKYPAAPEAPPAPAPAKPAP